jgi:hypothetical protein
LRPVLAVHEQVQVRVPGVVTAVVGDLDDAEATFHVALPLRAAAERAEARVQPIDLDAERFARGFGRQCDEPGRVELADVLSDAGLELPGTDPPAEGAEA